MFMETYGTMRIHIPICIILRSGLVKRRFVHHMNAISLQTLTDHHIIRTLNTRTFAFILVNFDSSTR